MPYTVDDVVEPSPRRSGRPRGRFSRPAAALGRVLAGAAISITAGACAGPMIVPAEVFDIEAEDTVVVGAGEPGDSVVVVRVDTVEAEESAAVVEPGIQVLLRQGGGVLRGRRVGLITNHTGRLPDGTSAIDALHASPDLELVALLSPEHGIRGTAEAGERVASGRDAETGLPIHSLYGETRKPTPAMLEGVDALAFDIQDIGTRYYTYVWTMAHSMEAAAEAGIPFVVLDRPNPIGGELVQGNVLEYPEMATFVGLYPVPMRHGMTAGEIARWVNGEFGLGADLTVVPAEGWRRDLWFDETGLPWLPPSPNMPSLESATHYPGTCLFEGTNLSVGRGTDRAFQQIGAPWLDVGALLTRLGTYELPGVRITAVSFTPRAPGDRKFDGQEIPGVRLHVGERATYDPTRTAIALLTEIHRLHPDRLEWRESHFDRLAGTRRVREAILAGASLEAVTEGWNAQMAAFRAGRAPYLLYP